MKTNATEIPIFKQNNVLCIVTQKVHKNEWNVYNVYQPQKKSSLERKVPANQEKDVCVHLKVKMN